MKNEKEGKNMSMIFFVEKDTFCPYNSERHNERAKKFLMYHVPVEGDILVVGSQDKHELLDKQTKDQAVVPVDVDPIAAGNILEGVIVGWLSLGFDIETPQHLRVGISESLKMKYISVSA